MRKILINNLTKKYKHKIILENLSLEIQGGQCYGLLGKNGVGKTTLISCILDLLKLEEGEIEIEGYKYERNAQLIKSKIGVLSEDNPLITEFTGKQYLEFVGLLYEIPKDELKKRLNSLYTFFFEQESDLNKQIVAYSTGMKKKLALCAAVLHRPTILILDEPFAGLDLVAANQFIKFLNFYLNEERCILLSSHDLAYVNKIATHIAVLNDKKIIFDGIISNFTSNGQEYIDDALYNMLCPTDIDLSQISWIK